VPIEKCRLCRSAELRPVINLGSQALSGLFPRPTEHVPCEPLELVRCASSDGCGLVQLRHSCDPGVMYGDRYGYRSSLNASMVDHLRHIAERLQRMVTLTRDDLVLDIGSNDGTLLSCYPENAATLLGVDPTAKKFRRSYRGDIHVIEDFFSASKVRAQFPGKNAKIVTSIAMVYDLEEPLRFAAEVREILHRDGVWFFEQSYLPSMVRVNAYDTICHEHLEYYALRQIDFMLRSSGLRAISVEVNPVNGGSFAVAACTDDSPRQADATPDALRAQENDGHLSDESTWTMFRERVERHRDELRSTMARLKSEGRLVLGYGASTKGNILLQYCGFGPADIPAIGEVNSDKFDCVTPGTRIPIISEEEMRRRDPAALLVLPWHFRDFIVEKERSYLESGGSLLFPLSEVEILRR
jgi:NDP-4-keto-2,6-dideoxyhexose 3-C-methyltransferase